MDLRMPHKGNDRPVMAMALCVAAGVFALDILTPRGMAPQMLYAVALMISIWTLNERFVKRLAWLSTALTVAAFAFGSGDPSDAAVFNRVVSLGLIWLTAVLVLLYMRAEERLRQINLNLERLVSERTAALMQAVEQRERLGRDLHDDILQLLYAAGLNLKATIAPLKACPPDVAGQIRHTVGELELAMERLRDYITGPRRSTGSEPPVGVALADLVQDMGAPGRPRFRLTLQPGLSAVSLPKAQTEQILHIVREALSNCLRHSRAIQGFVTVQREHGMLSIDIRDDGVGFHPGDAMHAGHGLANMATRAGEIGGTLTIASQPGQGTHVAVRIPCTELVSS